MLKNWSSYQNLGKKNLNKKSQSNAGNTDINHMLELYDKTSKAKCFRKMLDKQFKLKKIETLLYFHFLKANGKLKKNLWKGTKVIKKWKVHNWKV